MKRPFPVFLHGTDSFRSILWGETVLTQPGCQVRQKRLLKWMEKEQWDFFMTSDYRTVYYFTGMLESKDFPTLFLQDSDG